MRADMWRRERAALWLVAGGRGPVDGGGVSRYDPWYLPKSIDSHTPKCTP